MTYRITENPPPGKTGESLVKVIDDSSLVAIPLVPVRSEPRLVHFPYYTIVTDGTTNKINQRPAATPPIIIETTVVNSSATLSSLYEDNTAGIANISSRTPVTNNGLGADTFEDILPPIWDKILNQINSYSTKEIIEVQLRFTVSTDTLGGAFEIQLETLSTNNIIDTQEFNTNIQEQDYTVIFKIVTRPDDVTSGIGIYIEPELGMTLSLTNIEFVFIRTVQL